MRLIIIILLFFVTVGCTSLPKSEVINVTNNIRYIDIEFILEKALKANKDYIIILKNIEVKRKRSEAISLSTVVADKKELLKLESEINVLAVKLNKIKKNEYNKVFLIIKKYSKENRIDHLYDINNGIIYFNKSLDITKNIIEIFDKTVQLSNKTLR